MKKILFIAVAAFISTAAFAQKFGHINYQETIQVMNEMDAAIDDLQTARQAAGETYQEMIEEFNGKYQTYEQKKATWAATPSVLASKERELQELQQRIQEFQSSIQQELAEKEQSLMAPLAEKLQAAVEKVAKDNSLIYVFDVTSVLYVDKAQSMDITSAVRKALGIADDRTLETVTAARQAKYAAQQQ